MTVFWDDVPGSILVENCYVANCQTRTSGGGSRDGSAVSLCAQHRTEADLEAALTRLKGWREDGGGD
jgi:hypothetical protein